jgi:hypothetical protein
MRRLQGTSAPDLRFPAILGECCRRPLVYDVLEERIYCNMPRVLGITLEHHAMMGRGGLGSPVMSSIPDTVAMDGVDGSQPSSPAGTSRERRCLALFPCKPDGSFNSRIYSKEEERGRALRPGSSQLKSL